MSEAILATAAEETNSKDFDSFDIADWLLGEMKRRDLSIPDLAAKSGLSAVAIYNIVKRNTSSPREETRKKLAAALNSTIPEDVEVAIEKEQTLAVPGSHLPGYQWSDFTPSDLNTIPDKPGVYVFYDITGRPVYIGKSNTNVRVRVKDHQTRFWFKEPLVVKGAFLAIADKDLCDTIELVLIKFLGPHALLNVKGATRDIAD